MHSFAYTNLGCAMHQPSYEKAVPFCPLQVEEALAHEYLATLHDISDEPVCSNPFNFDLESDDLTPDVVGLC